MHVVGSLESELPKGVGVGGQDLLQKNELGVAAEGTSAGMSLWSDVLRSELETEGGHAAKIGGEVDGQEAVG